MGIKFNNLVTEYDIKKPIFNNLATNFDLKKVYFNNLVSDFEVWSGEYQVIGSAREYYGAWTFGIDGYCNNGLNRIYENTGQYIKIGQTGNYGNNDGASNIYSDLINMQGMTKIKIVSTAKSTSAVPTTIKFRAGIAADPLTASFVADNVKLINIVGIATELNLGSASGEVPIILEAVIPSVVAARVVIGVSGSDFYSNVEWNISSIILE